MNVIIVGAGRIGLPLGLAAREAGHQVHFLVRENSHNIQRLEQHDFPLTSGLITSANNIDAIILAANINEANGIPLQNSLEELKASISELKNIDTNTAVLSVMGSVPLKTLKANFTNLPIIRFFCSSAVVNPSSIRFYEVDSDSEAVEKLLSILPSPNWTSVDTKTFTRYGKILCFSALHCSILAQAKNLIGSSISDDEEKLLLRTLKEAELMVESNNKSPLKALQSAITPNGTTLTLHNQYLINDINSFEQE